MQRKTYSSAVTDGPSGAGARVCLALPVHNGARFLAETLADITSQSFEDLDIVVVDNASTDQTEAVARDCAARDTRVRYKRHPDFVDVVTNYNRCLQYCNSEFFKWCAADDRIAQTYVQHAVDVLDATSTIIGCYGETAMIASDGATLPSQRLVLDLSDEAPSARFLKVISARPWIHGVDEQYGVFRSAAVRRAGGMSSHAYGDRVLLARLALLGPMAKIGNVLFYNREHNDRSTRSGIRLRPGMVLTRRLSPGPWPPSEAWDPRKTGRIVFPEWDLLAEYFRRVHRSELPYNERARCYLGLGAYAGTQVLRLGRDLAIGFDQSLQLLRRGRSPWRGGLDSLTASSTGMKPAVGTGDASNAPYSHFPEDAAQ